MLAPPPGKRDGSSLRGSLQAKGYSPADGAPRAHAIGAPGYSETLPCEEQSASNARRLVSAVLSTWGLDDLTEEAKLITSELVANALQHSGGRVMRLAISRPTPDRVRVAVSDRSRTAPSPQPVSGDGETGRGLIIVDALCDRWGTDQRRWGKVVWGELLTEGGT